MKKNALLEELRKTVSKEIKREIDLSFDIVNRIHDILERKNFDQKDLAKLLGKSEAEISKWMRGTHNFTLKTLTKIEAALDEPILEVAGKPSRTEYVFVSIPQEKVFSKNHKREMSNTAHFSFSYSHISKCTENPLYI
ncbi:MAG: helix-turn-helix transcriptional regulator [Bacteroidales bacterium]|jgi:transcriptional regulator with XRE-family HTH domain|nr:helix-turn-helix transcriptional regulator [Bacteroidales bacterium]